MHFVLLDSGFEEVVKSLRETAAEAPKLAVQRTYSVPPSSSAATVLPGTVLHCTVLQEPVGMLSVILFSALTVCVF